MRELLRPFDRLHVLGLALLGCLAVAVVTGQGAWRWVGLVGAVIVSLWAGVLLHRDLRHRRT
jgi:hypothetical protein